MLNIIYEIYALNKSQSIICDMSFNLNIILFIDYLPTIIFVHFYSFLTFLINYYQISLFLILRYKLNYCYINIKYY